MKGNEKNFTVDLQVHLMLYRGDSFKVLLNLMVRNGIDAVAVLEYDWNSLTDLKNLIKRNKKFLIEKKKRKEVDYFGNGFRFEMNGEEKFIILGKEIIIEGHHFLAPGIVTPLKEDNLEETVEEVWQKGGIPILDHPFADPESSFGKMKDKKLKRVLDLVQKKKIALEYNGYCIKWVRGLLFRDDPNSRVLELGKKHNLPVIPTTDLHAQSKDLMEAVGTGLIKIPRKRIDSKDLVHSIRKAIFDFDFEPRYRTVPFNHFFWAFGLPYLREKLNQA